MGDGGGMWEDREHSRYSITAAALVVVAGKGK